MRHKMDIEQKSTLHEQHYQHYEQYEHYTVCQ